MCRITSVAVALITLLVPGCFVIEDDCLHIAYDDAERCEGECRDTSDACFEGCGEDVDGLDCRSACMETWTACEQDCDVAYDEASEACEEEG